jgi:hypothetical protein
VLVLREQRDRMARHLPHVGMIFRAKTEREPGRSCGLGGEARGENSTTSARLPSSRRKKLSSRLSRSMLLAGTTFAAASAIASGSPVRVAQAQAQPLAPTSGRKQRTRLPYADEVIE